MRSFIAVLFIQCVTGFSPVSSSSSARSALFATDHHNDYFDSRPMGIALTTFALGWAMGSYPILAADHPSLSSTNNNDNYSMMMGSIPTLTVALSDSDYADFSLPSYKEVSSAEINTNLKGSKQIFSDSRFELSASSSDNSADSSKVAVTQTSSADLLVDKAAAKIAAKAARERQLKAVEAAAAAK
jgi:hypothetical protein